MRRILLVSLPIFIATACDNPTVCAGVGAPNVAVTVVDSLTGAPAAALAVLLTYDLDRGGVRVDSIVGERDDQELWGSTDRTGRFSVFVRKNGYRDWVHPEVFVRPGCTIQTAYLTARLARP